MSEEKLLMNGVEVILKNPGTKGLKDFLIIQKAMSKMPKINIKGKTKEQIDEELLNSGVNYMDYLDDKALDSLINLMDLSLNNTFKERTEEIEQWAMANSVALMGKVLSMCTPKKVTDDDDRKEDLVERLKRDNAESSKK